MIDTGHRSDCTIHQGWDCCCGRQDRIALATEQTMHAAWRKRAEEAEAEALALRADLARISEEMGLPPTIGPAPGTLKRLLDDGKAAAAEALALREALCMIYEKYEDGGQCFEGPDCAGSYMGNAVHLDGDEENQILALIPKERDAAIAAARKGEA